MKELKEWEVFTCEVCAEREECKDLGSCGLNAKANEKKFIVKVDGVEYFIRAFDRDTALMTLMMWMLDNGMRAPKKVELEEVPKNEV